VFRLQNPIEVGDDVPLTSQDMYITQPAFILGYPYELSFTVEGTVQQLPIVKSCIVAGLTTDEDGVFILYIDTIVNPGFSGGPLTFVDLSTKQPKFAGVVVKGLNGFIREPTPEEPKPPKGPAGIGIVHLARNFEDAMQSYAQ
jgi:hypothetical protein